MTQALYNSMTGMNAGTQQLTVVSDNVANMNTTAYKTSRVDFQDIWYQTRTSGTPSTRNSGGTNPFQIGVGVRCAAITKDFAASSTNTTGKSEDLALAGNGWFTVLNSDGKILMTRDGSFSLDENGFLCTANGSKVLGMGDNISYSGSTTPIKVPTSVKIYEEPTPTDKFTTMFLRDLNGLGTSYAGITNGKFNVVLLKNDGSSIKKEVNLENTENMQVSGLVDIINAALDGAGTVKAVNGALEFTPGDGYDTVNFEAIPERNGGSNIVGVMDLIGLPNVGGKFTTKTLNTSANLGLIDDITSEYAKQYDSFSFGYDGLMTVVYGDGSQLTVRTDANGSTYFSYQNAQGIIIDDDPQNSGNASLYVDPNVLEKANMQMQIMKVVNNGGLVARGNNQYELGPNAGQYLFTAGNVNGVGAVITGALEASNVDLAQQFSNMILAQRLVQANSRVFSGANSMLETLVYLGQ